MEKFSVACPFLVQLVQAPLLFTIIFVINQNDNGTTTPLLKNVVPQPTKTLTIADRPTDSPVIDDFGGNNKGSNMPIKRPKFIIRKPILASTTVLGEPSLLAICGNTGLCSCGLMRKIDVGQQSCASTT